MARHFRVEFSHAFGQPFSTLALIVNLEMLF
jgi:hypothetical protein